MQVFHIKSPSAAQRHLCVCVVLVIQVKNNEVLGHTDGICCVCCSVFMEIVGEKSRHSLQESLHLITAPVQVIWGKEDQVRKKHSDVAKVVE